MKTSVFALCVCLVLLGVSGAPPRYTGNYNYGSFISGIEECFGLKCPKNSVSCYKQTTTSPDGRNLITERSCMDAQGNALLSDTQTEDNQNGGTLYSGSYYYSRAYSSGRSNNDVFSNNVPSYKTTNSDVEEFDSV